MTRWCLLQTLRLWLLLVILTLSIRLLGQWFTSDVFIYSARVNHEEVTSEIRLYDRRTGVSYVLIYGHQITQLSLTADGRSVIYGQFAGISRHEIWTHRAHESNLIRPDDNAMPVVSPNGGWIAYQSLFTSELNERDTLLVVDNGGYARYDAQLRATAWAWFPDSERLTFAVLERRSVRLYWLDLETGAVSHIITIPFAVRDMVWSPDGTRLLMSDGARLLSYDTATGFINRLYQSPSDLIITPQWSADGTRILWLSVTGIGQYRAVIANAQGKIIESFVLEDMITLNRITWWQTRQ